MRTRRAVIVGMVVTVLMMIQHLWRTAGRPAFAPGDWVIDVRTGARGKVLGYHRWPYRHYVVLFRSVAAPVRPEHLTRAK